MSHSTARHILDLRRRGLLRGALGLAALAAIQPRPGRAQTAPVLGFARYPFTLGVASGEPAPDGMVLWTRLAPDPLAPMGGMPHAPVAVDWEVAADERFARIAASGMALARPELGFAVHVEVAGLPPGRPWWYRFRAGREASPVGRTRTAPAPDAAPARIRFAQAGCQHLEHGHFTAWRHVAEEPDLDFVFHYGDYIYEYRGVIPGQPSWGPTVRSHAGEEIHTLDNYRARYAQYRADPDLQAAHAAHPFIATFDDHEVDNNWAAGNSEEDGVNPRFPVAVPPEVFALRMQAAFQAWYEHMPVRRGALPRGPSIQAHRRLSFGRLLDLHALDTRQYRDDQPCGDGFNRPACAAVGRADAQMLGAAQEAWLLEGVARPGAATWQVLAQQVMMSPLALPNGINLDAWDAYPAARARLLRGLAERRVAGAVVLTGDVHTAWAGELRAGPDGPVVATEFVATSISSGGDGSETRPGVEETLRRNPDLRFFNNRRGYCLHEASPARLEVTYRALPYVTRPGAPREDRGRFVVEAGRPGMVAG